MPFDRGKKKNNKKITAVERMVINFRAKVGVLFKFRFEFEN